MTTLTEKIKQIENTLGFYDVQGFQQAWNLGPALVVDGLIGPKTTAALEQTMADDHRLSAHFRAEELQCPHCKKLICLRGLLVAAEVYRDTWGPLPIVSGYRCSDHNKSVGGASRSQHLYGRAIDVHPTRTLAAVSALGAFRALGYSPSSHLVVHADMRPGFTPARPLTFTDGS
jgi:hypothetical protein